jgi:TIR domain
MPLDELGRRYADELFNAKLERILPLQQGKRVEVRQDHARRNATQSGSYVAAEGRIQAGMIRLLAEAKAKILLSAYERAGLPFDDSALREITEEVSQFCATQQHHAIASLSEFAKQTFAGSAPPNLLESIAGEMESSVRAVIAKIARDLRIRRYEIALDEKRDRKVYGAGMGKPCDVFISHASEDKKDLVEPLAEALQTSGLSVWYDKTALTVGDSLRAKIDEGLARSRYGVVILSHNFFAKRWPQQELDGLFTKEVAGAPGVKVILPVWHNLTADEVTLYSPMLAGRLAAQSSDGLEVVVRQLREAMGL